MSVSLVTNWMRWTGTQNCIQSTVTQSSWSWKVIENDSVSAVCMHKWNWLTCFHLTNPGIRLSFTFAPTIRAEVWLTLQFTFNLLYLNLYLRDYRQPHWISVGLLPYRLLQFPILLLSSNESNLILAIFTNTHSSSFLCHYYFLLHLITLINLRQKTSVFVV